MSVISSIVVGKARKSVGNVTLSTDAAGRTIMRQKPTTVRNPNSEGQKFQRERFKNATALIKSALPAINTMWTRKSPIVAPFQEATSQILTNWNKEQSNIDKLVKTRVQLFKGSLEQFHGNYISDAGYIPGVRVVQIEFNFDPNTFGNGNPTDNIKLVLINVSKGYIETESTPGTRTNGRVSAEFTLRYAGDYYVVATAFYNSNKSMWGNGYTVYWVNTETSESGETI